MKNNSANIESVAIPTKQPTTKLEKIFHSFPLDRFFNKPVISILRITGVIGHKVGMRCGVTLENLNEVIEKTFKPSKLSAVCLVINSPGGSPVQSELIATRIRQLSFKKNVPVYSFIEDVAASGGYWLACAGDEIYASKNSIVGSIGVVSSSFGFHKAIEKLGIERRMHAMGENKAILDPFQPEKKDDVQILKNIQKQVHQYFIDYVKTQRKGKLTQTDETLFNGKVWTGEIASDFGLIDGIDNLYNFIENKFGKNVDIRYSAVKQSWLKKKLGMQQRTEEIIESIVQKLINKMTTTNFDMY